MIDPDDPWKQNAEDVLTHKPTLSLTPAPNRRIEDHHAHTISWRSTEQRVVT